MANKPTPFERLFARQGISTREIYLKTNGGVTQVSISRAKRGRLHENPLWLTALAGALGLGEDVVRRAILASSPRRVAGGAR